jgi:DNA-binding transcriptional LysR family regulator
MSKGAKFDFNLFRALEVFATVVETRQVTRAATILGMTQSAASQHLKNLEAALGASLVDRKSRPIELTKAGIALHQRAIRVLNEIEDLRSDVRRIQSAPLPLLRVAMLASIATTLMPTVVSIARGRFGIPEVSAFAGLATDHESLLRSRRADLAVTSDALFDVDGLIRYSVLKERFLLVTPKGYSGPANDLAAMARELPLVRFAPSTPVGRRIDQHLRRIRLELPRAIDADRASMVISPVAAGCGFAILCPTLLIDGLAEGMKVDVRPLPIPGFTREIMVVARERELGEIPIVFAREAARTLLKAITRWLPGLPPGTVRPITETP